MGELFRRFEIKVKIEDTTNDNPREAEHFHYYFNGKRMRIFFKNNRHSYEFDPKQVHNHRVVKQLSEVLDNEEVMNEISKEYDKALRGERVDKIDLRRFGL